MENKVGRGRQTALLVAGLAAVVLVVWRPWADSRVTTPHSAQSTSGDAPARAIPNTLSGKDSAPGSSIAIGNAPAIASTGVVFFSPWGGSSPNQVGRDRPKEGNPEGPMSLAVDARGGVVVLDQVNGRLVRHAPDGSPAGTVALTQRVPQDVATAKDGSVAVLDRLGNKSIALYDAAGKPRGELPLAGEGVAEPGLLTAIIVDGDDVYVEREHGPVVKIGDVRGNPATTRTELPGRPTRDGKAFLTAGITDAATGRVWVAVNARPGGANRFTREIKLGAPVTQILLLDADLRGTIYFAIELERDPSAPSVQLLCLEPQKGTTIGSRELPANTSPDETLHDFAVQDDGGVVYAMRGETGVAYARFDCRP